MKLLLKSYLIILCLTFGIGTSWAETYTLALESGDLGTTPNPATSVSKNDVSWKIDWNWKNVNYKYIGWENARGVQVGKEAANYGETVVSLSTSGIFGDITKVKVNASTAASGSGTISVTVGGVPFKYNSSNFVDLTSSAAYYDFVGTASGEIVVTFTNTHNAKAMFIKSISVDYGDNSSTPQPTTYNVSIANDIANGTVTASPTSATAGTEITLTATPSEGYEFGAWNVTTSKGSSVAVINNKFNMPEDNVNVSATFNNKAEGNVPDEPGDDTGKLVYKKISSQSDIVNGGVYLIVCESLNTAMGSQSTNRRNNASVTISNGTITLESANEEGKPFEVTLGQDNNKWTMKLSNKKYLGNGVTNSNYLKEVQSVAFGYRWDITYEEDGSVTMTNDHESVRRTLCVNTSNSTDSYSTYTDGSKYQKVTLYKKLTGSQETTTITLNSACHDEQSRVYASYSNDKAWVVPADLTVEEIGVTENGRLTLKAYATGAVVPANTGVMVSASAQSVQQTNGNYTVNISDEQGSSVLGEGNRLRPASNIAAAAMAEKDPNCLYYRLTMHNGEKIGYWWGAENGAAFDITASNKAYLAVPKQKDAVKYMGIWLDDDASCIDAVKGNDAANGVAYNLAGQRVTADVKGIVIVNGKKVFNK